MLMQEIIIRNWTGSRVPMEREGAAISPAARTFKIDNVNHYVKRALKWSTHEVMEMKGLCVKLPYPVCVFEYDDPASLKSKLDYPKLANSNFRFGAIAAYGQTSGVTIPAGTDLDKVDRTLASGIGKLVFLIYGNIERGGRNHTSALGMIHIPINGDGELIGDLAVKFPDRVANFGPKDLDNLDVDQLVEALRGNKDAEDTHRMCEILVPIFYALSLLNCKNIRQTEHVESKNRNQIEGPGGMRREFRMLDVPLINKIYSGEIPLSSLGAKKGLHTVRGHFKTFTKEKPTRQACRSLVVGRRGPRISGPRCRGERVSDKRLEPEPKSKAG